VLIAEDATLDGQGWLRCAEELEQAAGRVRGQRWGPRTLDVDLISCYQTSPVGDTPVRDIEVFSRDDGLTLPHPLAHLRAFVMVPWLAVDPNAELTVADGKRPVAELLAELDLADRAGVRLTGLVLTPRAEIRESDPAPGT
jgi:2-amino-4-hydroxy-6-hydroxymethyldihydropteridine diphosphokinase